MAMLAGYYVAAVLDIAGIIGSLVLLVLLVTRVRSFDQLTVTVAFSFAASVALTVYSVGQAATFARTPSTMTLDASGNKVTTADLAQTIAAPIALCFGMMTVLQISLVWITVAQAVERLRVIDRSRIGLKVVLAVVYVALLGVALACILLGKLFGHRAH